jgi:superfamily II DNA or RNA helicase
MNQIVQRIGRTIRKTAGKDTALIYTIYLSYTRDFNTLKMVRQATDVVVHENKGQGVSTSTTTAANLDRYIV